MNLFVVKLDAVSGCLIVDGNTFLSVQNLKQPFSCFSNF